MQAITPGIWEATFDFARPGGTRLPCRMTVVALPDGGLAIISPIALHDTMRAAVDALGTVRMIVAPNRYHHIYLGPWQAAYPKAEIWGAPGLQKKRAGIRFTGELDPAKPPPALGGALELLLIEGAEGMNEIVLYHPASKTLIVTDFMFNLNGAYNWQTRLVFRAMGVLGRVAQSRFWRIAFVKDRARTRKSAERLLAWPFTRMISAHGNVVDEGAHEAATTALAWLLG